MSTPKKTISETPELLDEWDFDKNTIDPTNITVGSSKKAWWICKKQHHSWQATINNRAKGVGCPYCSGYMVSTGVNDLETLYPELAEEWDYEKNGDLKPNAVSCGTNKKVWWLCKDYQHSWQAIVNNRTKHNQGCPYCAGKRVLVGFNDLSTTNPDVAAEWDCDKNGDLKPTDVTRGCNKNVWWSCQNHHSWQAYINNRTKGYGCPYCSGERAVKGVNDLATVYPNLLEEWDFNKNTGIDIYSLLPGSNKKVWWKCSKCGYEWNSVISSRTSKQECGCPLCANMVVVTGINDLATTNPELLEEWDYNKNKNLDPKCVVAGSPKKAWWICKKCGRSWQTEISVLCALEKLVELVLTTLKLSVHGW